MNPSTQEQLELFKFYKWQLDINTVADLNTILSEVGEFHHTLDNILEVLKCIFNNISIKEVLPFLRKNGTNI